MNSTDTLFHDLSQRYAQAIATWKEDRQSKRDISLFNAHKRSLDAASEARTAALAYDAVMANLAAEGGDKKATLAAVKRRDDAVAFAAACSHGYAQLQKESSISLSEGVSGLSLQFHALLTGAARGFTGIKTQAAEHGAAKPFEYPQWTAGVRALRSHIVEIVAAFERVGGTPSEVSAVLVDVERSIARLEKDLASGQAKAQAAAA